MPSFWDMSDIAKQRFTAIDFFCGGGGMTCGLRQSGIDVIAGVDFDPTVGETYEFNNPGSKFINSDINILPESYFDITKSISDYFPMQHTQLVDNQSATITAVEMWYTKFVNNFHVAAQIRMTLIPL